MIRTVRHHGFGETCSQHGVADFTTFDNLQAQRRVQQLAAAGLPDSSIATMVGWSVIDVRRALSPPSTATKGVRR